MILYSILKLFKEFKVFYKCEVFDIECYLLFFFRRGKVGFILEFYFRGYSVLDFLIRIFGKVN